MSTIEPHAEKLKYIFDNAKVGIAICNAEDNTLELVNPAFAHIHGYEPHELIGVSPGNVFAPECMLRLEAHESIPSCAINDVSFETTHFRQDGSLVPVSVHITVIKDENGAVKQRIANIQDISDRKKAESELILREREFRSLAESIPDNIARWDCEGRYLYINPVHERTLGKSLDEVIGTFVPDHHKAVKEAILHVAAIGEKITVLETVVSQEGSIEYHEVSIVPERDALGNIVSVLGIGRDITERKLAEEAFKSQSVLLQSVLESSPDVTIFALDREYNYIAFNHNHRKIIREIWGHKITVGMNMLDSITREDDHQKAKELFDKALEGECFVNETEYGDENLSRSYWQTYYAPMIDNNGEIIGLTCFNLNITNKRTAELQLHKTKAKLSAVISTIPDLIWVKDVEGIYMMCNPAFENFFGASCKEILGKTDYDFISREQADFFRQKDREAMAAGEMRINEEEIIFAHNGQRALLETRKIPVYSGDEFMGVLGIGRDITERKKQEELLRQKEEEFRAVIENSPDTISRYDLDCRRTYVNPKFEELFGLPAEELLGKTPSNISPIPENLDFENKLREVARTGAEIVVETLFFTPSGEMGWGHLRIVPEFGKSGDVISVLAIGRDITERKKQELLLLSKEEEFRSLAENAHDPIYRYDRNCRRIYINPAVERISGKPASMLLGKTPLEISFISSEEIMKVMQSLEKVLRTGEPDEIEVKFVAHDGSEYYFQHSHVPEFCVDGTVEGILAIGRDVTAQKQLENDLYAREEMFRTLAENSPNMIMRYDKECRRIYVNPAYCVQTGIPIEVAINGKPDTQWDVYLNMLTMSAQEYQERIGNVILSGNNDNFTVEWVRLNDGVHVTHDLHIVAERDGVGNIMGVLAIGHDITERKIIEKKIEHIAHHDALTGLPNRILVKERTEQIIANAKRSGAKAAFLFIDLDGFKAINDTMGHSVGDEVLKIVASRLMETIRSCDTISRHGGDEFLLIFSDVTDINDFLSVVEKLLLQIEDPFPITEYPLSLSASIGIALYPEHGETFEALLKNADTAMYKAKESGKNGYCLYTEQMHHNLLGEFKLQNDLKSAISNNEFVLHYQPQIDLALNRITGAEALVRWEHPQLGMIPPMNFIPLAESNGLIVQIGQWVLEEACTQAALWHAKGIAITVAVNISAVQFKRGNLEAVVKKALDISGINPRFLELELTESILIHDAENILKTVRTLKELGIQLSIDDFGTGYSSLSYLKRFAVDKLKIDQSFVRDILRDQEDAAIVRTIIQIAKSLNLKTIAEGVEDASVLSVIGAYGCDEVQGYHFAKPLEAAAFELFHANFRK